MPWARRRWVPIPLLLVVLAVAAGTPVRASGTTIVVTTTTDEQVVDGNCSLREAITAANTDRVVDACPAGHGRDSIMLPAGTYGLSIAGVVEDTNETGDLDLASDADIVGAGSTSTIIDAHGIDRVLDIAGAATVDLSGLTLTGGFLEPDATGGAGIANRGATASLDDVIVTGNGSNSLGLDGAGIANHGTMRVTRSTVAGNIAYDGLAGGIWNDGMLTIEDSTIRDNTNRLGGGIANGGTLTIARSTIANNAASEAGDYNSPSGGGLYNAGSATLVNATVSGNGSFASDRGFAHGAGISNAGLLTVIESTIADNQNDERCVVSCGGAGHDAGIAGPATLAGTIVAGNSATFDDVTDGLPPDTVAADCTTITSSGGNVIGSSSGCSISGGVGSDLLDVNPLLGPLADNGGPTLTRPLGAGSPAIDLVPAGSNGCGTTIMTDQRGISRPQGNGCDSGAYEAVQYSFSGFFGPVRNLPVLNTAVAGSAIPIVFSLGGDEGLDILAPNSPESQAISCATKTPAGPLEPATAAGASRLAFDPTTDRYTYVWKTDMAWTGTCRQLVVTLIDGSVHRALILFR